MQECVKLQTRCASLLSRALLRLMTYLSIALMCTPRLYTSLSFNLHARPYDALPIFRSPSTALVSLSLVL